jgi:hypothetical protein
MRAKSYLEILAEAEQESLIEDMERTGEGMIHATTPPKMRGHERVPGIVQPVPVSEPEMDWRDRILMRPELTPEERRAAWIAATHEKAHEMTSEELGLGPSNPNADVSIIVAGGNGVSSSKRGTPFQESVIGWSGLVGQAITGAGGANIPVSEKLTIVNARDWYNKFLDADGLDMQSKSDRMSIKGWRHPAFRDSAWPAFEKAVELVARNLPIIEVLAEGLIRDCEEIIKCSRIDPEAGKRAMDMWTHTRSLEHARIAAHGEQAMADHLEAMETAEREPMWVTATVPLKFR